MPPSDTETRQPLIPWGQIPGSGVRLAVHFLRNLSLSFLVILTTAFVLAYFWGAMLNRVLVLDSDFLPLLMGPGIGFPLFLAIYQVDRRRSSGIVELGLLGLLYWSVICGFFVAIEGASNTPDTLTDAIQQNDTEAFHWLLQHGADPNFRSPRQNPPLFQAISNGDAELVELLLEAGADPLHPRGAETTPLSVAGEMGDAEIIALLEEAAAAARAAGEVHDATE